MPLITVESPTSEPVTLDEIRAQCRLDDDMTDDDEQLKHYISAAREYCEQHTGRHFAAKTLRYAGCAEYKIPLAANIGDVHYVQYIDTNEVAQALPETSYYVDQYSLVGQLLILNPWPATSTKHPYPIEIEFDVGESECPLSVKQAILLLAAHWFENRESAAAGFTGKELGETLQALLTPHRVLHL